MKNSSSGYTQLLSQKNHALPYSVNIKYEVVATPPIAGLDAVGPAGSVNSTVEDMGRYALFHLGQGSLRGAPLMIATSFDRIHTPSMPFSQNDPLAKILFSKLYPGETAYYQLGWIESKRHGLKIVEHSGGTRGYAAHLLLVPEKGMGVIVLSNLDTFPSLFLAHDVLDHLMEKEPKEFAYSSIREMKELFEKSRLANQENASIPTPTPREVEEVLGNYVHEGEIFPFSITQDAKELVLIYQDQRFGFGFRGKNIWSLESEDVALQGFLFQWNSERNGFYVRSSSEAEDIPMAFFGKIS